jgi:lauroyl/myristoyl acyltransferase
VIRYATYRILIGIVGRVSAATAYRSATIVADVTSITAFRARRVLVSNLRKVVGDVEDTAMKTMVRVAFRNLVWNYLELFRVPSMDLGSPSPDVVNPVHTALRTVTDDGAAGAVVAFCHVGNVEVGAQQVALSLPGLRFAVVIEHMADERIFQLSRDVRSSKALEVVQADEPIRILQLLDEGCSVIIAADLDTTNRGIYVDFFGKPARMPTGAVKLAMRTGAPLVFAQAWRTSVDEDPQRFAANVTGPIEMPGSVKSAADVAANVSRLINLVEDAITEHPEQWLAFHAIWDQPA